MGCRQTKLSRSAAAGSMELSVDTHAIGGKKLIPSCPDLKLMTEQYSESILPRITKALSDLTARLDDAYEASLSSHAALLAYQTETEKGNRKKGNKRQKKQKKKHTEDAFAKVTAELGKLEQTNDYLKAQELLKALGDLNNMMDQLLVRKAVIEKRMRSAKRWRKVWSVAFTAAFIMAMLAIVGLAVCGIPPMVISAVTAVATAAKAVEPWFDAVWDEKEKELKDAKEIVEEMREGVWLAHELESVRPKLRKVRIDFGALAENLRFALREKNEASLAVVVAEMEKKLGEVESEILKDKMSEWADKIQRTQSKLNNIIRN